MAEYQDVYYLCRNFLKSDIMLIIEVKDTENIDRALKRYKRKVQNTRLIKEIRKRREFVKPSVKRRNEILKAEYRNKKFNTEQ